MEADVLLMLGYGRGMGLIGALFKAVIYDTLACKRGARSSLPSVVIHRAACFLRTGAGIMGDFAA